MFWGTEVKPGKECAQKIEPNQTLKVSGVAFAGTPKDGRAIVQVSTGDKAYTIAVLKGGLQESVVLDLLFSEEEVKFSVLGSDAVHVTGNIIVNDDDEISSYDDDDEMESESGSSEEQDVTPAVISKPVQGQIAKPVVAQVKQDAAKAQAPSKAVPVAAAQQQAKKAKVESDSDEDDSEDEDDDSEGDEDDSVKLAGNANFDSRSYPGVLHFFSWLIGIIATMP